MDTRRSRGRDPRGEDWGWGAEREVERGKRKKGREKSKERKTRMWEAREMVGRGRKEGRREAGKHSRSGEAIPFCCDFGGKLESHMLLSIH